MEIAGPWIVFLHMYNKWFSRPPSSNSGRIFSPDYPARTKVSIQRTNYRHTYDRCLAFCGTPLCELFVWQTTQHISTFRHLRNESFQVLTVDTQGKPSCMKRDTQCCTQNCDTWNRSHVCLMKNRKDGTRMCLLFVHWAGVLNLASLHLIIAGQVEEFIPPSNVWDNMKEL